MVPDSPAREFVRSGSTLSRIPGVLIKTGGKSNTRDGRKWMSPSTWVWDGHVIPLHLLPSSSRPPLPSGGREMPQGKTVVSHTPLSLDVRNKTTEIGVLCDGLLRVLVGMECETSKAARCVGIVRVFIRFSCNLSFFMQFPPCK